MKRADEFLLEEFPTMLQCLADARLFELEATERGIVVREQCDYHFEETLSEKQFERLICEMKNFLAAWRAERFTR